MIEFSIKSIFSHDYIALCVLHYSSIWMEAQWIFFVLYLNISTYECNVKLELLGAFYNKEKHLLFVYSFLSSNV